MSDNVSEVSVNMQDPSVVESLLDDAELRKLPVGSEEFKAAVAAKAAKTDANSEDSATEEADQDDESSESDADEAEDDEKDESKQSKPKKKGVEKRIGELVKEREALKRELDQLKYQKTHKVEETAEVGESQFDKQKPKFGDFDNIADYQEALVDWKLEKKDFDNRVATEQQHSQKKRDEVLSAWTERETAFKSTVEDYEDHINVENLERLDAGQTALAFLGESEFGPQVLYKLLTDEELTEKFKSASDVRKVAILSKIESSFESDEPSVETKKTTVSKAPQPAKALPKGKSVPVAKSIYDVNLSFEEYNRLMDQRERAKSRK